MTRKSEAQIKHFLSSAKWQNAQVLVCKIILFIIKLLWPYCLLMNVTFIYLSFHHRFHRNISTCNIPSGVCSQQERLHGQLLRASHWHCKFSGSSGVEVLHFLGFITQLHKFVFIHLHPFAFIKFATALIAFTRIHFMDIIHGYCSSNCYKWPTKWETLRNAH